MTTPILEDVTKDPRPVWELSVAAFLPKNKLFQYLVHHSLLILILLFQVYGSLKLTNTAHPDEALYLITGHKEISFWNGGHPVYTNPSGYFSGAPQLYPVWGAMLDTVGHFTGVGGLWLARAFSLLCMLSSTVGVWWAANTLFGHRNPKVGLYTALVFSFSSSVVVLGHFATYDAVSFTCLVWAMAVAVWASKRNRSLWWSFLIGGLCGLAVLLKYSAAIDLPFVLLLGLVGFKWRGFRYRTVVRACASGLVTIGVLVVSGLTWAHSDLKGLQTTTTSRVSFTHSSVIELLSSIFHWEGLVVVLVFLGGLIVIRRQPVLGTVLLVGSLAGPAYQIHSGESTSLFKHVVLGLLIGVLLAGVLLSELVKKKGLGMFVAGTLIWLMMLMSLSQSAYLFAGWPNTSSLASTLSYPIKSDPYIRMVGDNPDPMEYAFPQTEYWQWTGTYDGSLTYKGLTGVKAYQQALKDGYFQLAFFDKSQPFSEVLDPQMKSFGYHLTDTVRSSDHTWHIWQKF